MKIFESTFRRMEKIIESVHKRMELYSLSIEPGTEDFLTKNPYKYVNYQKTSSADDAEESFNAALSQIPLCSPQGEILTRLEVLTMLALGLQVTPFAVNNRTVALPIYQTPGKQMMQIVETYDRLFYDQFQVHLVFGKLDKSAVAILEQRMESAYTYYVEEHGEWTEEFMAQLGDELSRHSFATFLRQRIKTHIMKGMPICYPVVPPVQSREWRRQREIANYDFPVLEGCLEEMRQFFYRDTFVYEQYAISGVVEASPQDVVIDAGAFVGDTACYFSRKVGENGKVFAFEIVPDTVKSARQNMLKNNCLNVEVLQNALSDQKSNFTVILNPYSNSAAFVADGPISNQETKIAVEAITLDSFVESRNIRVDFIKADVEGAELRMLQGARKTLSRFAPVCALSLYHRQEDYWQLPQYLKEVCPDYTFWFRCEAEPVLFAKRIC